MACLSLLPNDVLKTIMQYVPLKDRIGHCSLVSKRLHAAAVAATDRLVLDSQGCSRVKGGMHGVRPRNRKSAVQWLCNHGQQLTSLQFWSWPLLQQQQLLQELPCPNLLELEIVRGRVQLGPTADGYPGVMQDCTKLTRLKLLGYTISDMPEDGLIDSLSSLVHLQHLEAFAEAGKGLSIATLPRLQHLTCLHVMDMSTENLSQLSGLTNLQDLHLTEVGETKGCPSTVPGLALPTSLTILKLSDYTDAGIVSVVPTGLQHLQLSCGSEVDPPNGPGSWLSSLGRLQQLTSLYVLPVLNSVGAWPHAGPVYSALTASSNLVSLGISDNQGYGCPDGIWQFVFPASRKLPHLTSLDVFDIAAPHERSRYPAWSAVDLSCLISCCPSLCELSTLPLHPLLHVSELHKLTALTQLIMFHYPSDSGPDSSDSDSDCLDDVDGFEECVRGLAVVTHLRHLELKHVSQAVNFASLLPLTSLTSLTKFEVYWIPDFDSDGDEVDDGVFMSLGPWQTVRFPVSCLLCSIGIALSNLAYLVIAPKLHCLVQHAQ
jgi:hypothetical protein